MRRVRWLLSVLVFASCGAGAFAAQVQQPDTAEVYRVSINDAPMAGSATVYLADDGTLYVSRGDLRRWNLKIPSNPSFSDNGTRYYGVQTDLNLTAAVDAAARVLNIFAPDDAFVGAPAASPLLPISDRGSFLDYKVRRSAGVFTFNQPIGAARLSVQYIGRQSPRETGLVRGTTYLMFRSTRGRSLRLGEATTDGGWIGSSVPFAGVDWSVNTGQRNSDYSAPRVTVVAPFAGTMQVYIENVLWLRQEVEEGPLTVDQLPASASSSDIAVVFTDALGHSSEEIVRPSRLDTLSNGGTAFRLNVGVGHYNSRLPGTYYRNMVAVATMRHGFSKQLTGDVHAESIGGRSFVDAGLDYQAGDGQIAGFRMGGGTERTVQQFEYRLQRNRFSFRELLKTGTIRSISRLGSSDEYFLPAPAEEQVEEDREVSYSVSQNLSLALKFFRSLTTAGYPSKRATFEVRSRVGQLSVDLRPQYNGISHRLQGEISIGIRPTSRWSVSERTTTPEFGQASNSLSIRSEPRSPSEQWRYDARLVQGSNQTREVRVESDGPSGRATVSTQQLGGEGDLEWEAEGAIGFARDQLFTLPSAANDATALVALDGLPGIHVKLNGVAAGVTDARGRLLLRGLQSLSQNEIALDPADLKRVGAPLRSRIRVVPYPRSALVLTRADFAR
jgi:outer membrane usher protein